MRIIRYERGAVIYDIHERDMRGGGDARKSRNTCILIRLKECRFSRDAAAKSLFYINEALWYKREDAITPKAWVLF